MMFTCPPFEILSLASLRTILNTSQPSHNFFSFLPGAVDNNRAGSRLSQDLRDMSLTDKHADPFSYYEGAGNNVL